MNGEVLREVFRTYEVLKDSMKVTRRSIGENLGKLHRKTLFFGERENAALERLTAAEVELDAIMILSLFAAFERELRISIQIALESNVRKPTPTIARIADVTVESIERWTVSDMLDSLKDSIAPELRGRVKQIYEYRNWVAHGKNEKNCPSIRTDPKIVRSLLDEFVRQAASVI